MEIVKQPDISAKEHYRLHYQRELEAEAEWLRRGASEKVNSVETLLRRNQILSRTLLELGCGTGAVITECQRRRIAETYFAVDYSQEAIDYLKRTTQGIVAAATDITVPQSVQGHFDLVILSHVLEHLEEPDTFLSSIHWLDFDHLIIEVPLEDLLFGRLKGVFADRTANASGHVQFFTARSLRSLLIAHGFRIVDTRQYVPKLDKDTIKFLVKKNGWGTQRYWRMRLGAIAAQKLEHVWSRLYYAHYAVLCKKKTETVFC